MTLIVGAPVSNSSASNIYTITVPAGVTTSMIDLFAFGSASSTSFTSNMSASGATFTQLDARAATNMYVTVIKGTGLTAGQTISLALTSSQPLYLRHYYQDVYDFTAGTVQAGVRGASSASTTSGTITPASGATVALVALERTLATGTAVSSVTTTTGEAITLIDYAEDAANPGVSVYFGTFTAAAATARSTTITYSGASTNGYAALIKTTPYTPPTPAGRTINYVDSGGSLATGQAYYTSGPGIVAVPNEVRVVPSGYPSVANMLTQNPFYCAHRGGSLDWPEMSLYGYTQAVYWGAGALELSVNRTLDGVWADIQAYQITAGATNNTGQPTRPYMRWEELIEAYYSSHVIFVDPKYAASYDGELLDMMDALPGTPTDRFVAKYYGVSTGWPVHARARGYKTWGYFYQADVPSLPTYQGYWDILGMDYTADAASWSAIMAYGKPVMGHICPSSSAAATALGYGANGLMVSGVKEAIPRHA